jgi:hypothetical protein
MLGLESVKEMFAVVVGRDVMAAIELRGRVAELDDRKQAVATISVIDLVAEVTELD